MCHLVFNASPLFPVIYNTDFTKLVQRFEETYMVLSHKITVKRIQALHRDIHIKLRSLILRAPGKILLTHDNWSSLVFGGHSTITAHWIDYMRTFKSVGLDLVRFKKCHTGKVTCALLHETLSAWEITIKVREITTANENDMSRGTYLLFDHVNGDPGFQITDFHVRCITHVFNLSVRDCFKEIHNQVANIWYLLSAIR